MTRDSKSFGNAYDSNLWVKVSHLKNENLVDSGATIALSDQRLGATFLPRISNVVQLRSEKKMLRIDAPSIVAFVENEESLLNPSEIEPPGNSMRFQLPSVDFNVPVPTRELSLPLPATALKFSESCIKPLLN